MLVAQRLDRSGSIVGESTYHPDVQPPHNTTRLYTATVRLIDGKDMTASVITRAHDEGQARANLVNRGHRVLEIREGTSRSDGSNVLLICERCSSSLTGVTPSEPGLVICPECAHEHRFGMALDTCWGCGYELDGLPAERGVLATCPECGALNLPMPRESQSWITYMRRPDAQRMAVIYATPAWLLLAIVSPLLLLAVLLVATGLVAVQRRLAYWKWSVGMGWGVMSLVMIIWLVNLL